MASSYTFDADSYSSPTAPPKTTSPNYTMEEVEPSEVTEEVEPSEVTEEVESSEVTEEVESGCSIGPDRFFWWAHGPSRYVDSRRRCVGSGCSWF